MRVNVYAEEMTEEVEIVSKVIDGVTFTGLRIYLKSPEELHHSPHDNDESAVTFWGKKDLREVLVLALEKLNAHYGCMVGDYKQHGAITGRWSNAGQVNPGS